MSRRPTLLRICLTTVIASLALSISCGGSEDDGSGGNNGGHEVEGSDLAIFESAKRCDPDEDPEESTGESRSYQPLEENARQIDDGLGGVGYRTNVTYPEGELEVTISGDPESVNDYVFGEDGRGGQLGTDVCFELQPYQESADEGTTSESSEDVPAPLDFPEDLGDFAELATTD